jgi:hypothetical protein
VCKAWKSSRAQRTLRSGSGDRPVRRDDDVVLEIAMIVGGIRLGDATIRTVVVRDDNDGECDIRLAASITGPITSLSIWSVKLDFQ